MTGMSIFIDPVYGELLMCSNFDFPEELAVRIDQH